MKANFKSRMPITMSKQEINNLIIREKEKTRDLTEEYVASQMIAVILCTLEINYGWKKKRLNKFIDNLNATATLASKTNVFGGEVDMDDLINHLIDKYGIDCRSQAKGL